MFVLLLDSCEFVELAKIVNIPLFCCPKLVMFPSNKVCLFLSRLGFK